MKDIVITEEFPVGLTFENYVGDGWVQVSENTFRYKGPLNPEGKTVLQLRFTVADGDWFGSKFSNIFKNRVRLTYNNLTEYATATIRVEKPPVVINKKSLNKSVELGDNVVFNITISALNEEITSHNIKIKDIVPDGLKFIGCYGVDSNGNEIDVSYSTEDGNIIFKIAELYHNATIIATFKTTETGNLTNTVVYGLNNNNIKEGEYSQDSVFVNGRMTVDKKCMNETIFSGDPITFMVNITNNENFDLTNITLNEIFPDDLTYISFKGNNWTEEGTNKFKYQGSLSPNNSTCIYLNFIVSSDSKGYLKNKVTVNSNEIENVSSTELIYVNEPKISISKKVIGNNKKILGENVSYAIVVTCSNSEYCYNVDVTDLPANGLEFLDAYYLDNGQEIPASFKKDGNNIVFHLDKINKSMSIVVTFKTTETGVIKNMAKYKNTAKECEILVSDLNISLIKVTEDYVLYSPSSQLTVQGDEITYWVMITNKGKQNITNFTLTENPPEGFTYVSHSSNFEKIGDNVYKYKETLSPGAGADFYITYHIPGNVSGRFINSITASADEIENVTSSFGVYVEKQNVKIEKLALNKTAWVGENVTFEIIVSNNSTGNATEGEFNGGGIILLPNPDSEDSLEYPEVGRGSDGNYYIYHDVQIIDYVPDGLEFLDCYAIDDKGERIPVRYTIEGKKIVFKLDTLKRIATIKTTFKAISPGNQTNIIKKDNQTSNDTVEVKSKNATVQKITLNQTVSLGEDVSFKIVVTNTGTTDLSEVTITEKNPEGLKYKSFSGTGWSTNDGVHFSYEGILTPDESIDLVITFEAIKVGNWTNIVMLKTNGTEEKDSNNTTSIIENKTNTTITQNKTNTTIPDNTNIPDNETDIPNHDKNNETMPIHSNPSKITEIKTGNPILVLLMVLLILSGNYIRKIKK